MIFAALEQLFGPWQLSESIVLKSVPDNLDVTIPHVEEIASIGGEVRSDLDRIFVNSENQESFSNLVINLNQTGLVLNLEVARLLLVGRPRLLHATLHTLWVLGALSLLVKIFFLLRVAIVLNRVSDRFLA